MYNPPQRDDTSPTLPLPADSGLRPAPARATNLTESSALESSELNAALQLLVERAQYITGATGAALALPHAAEMVCRASAGSCAPAVGARLQVRSGLTGESIASRRLLRCDNAESDPRVNLEVCRALGIASIVVLPLLREKDGEVCGLFELLSDHPYAFEERDLVALERMADLALTALDLASQPGTQTNDAARSQSGHLQPGRTGNTPMPAWPTGKPASPALEWSMASNPPSSSPHPDITLSQSSQSLDLPRELQAHDFQANDFQARDFQAPVIQKQGVLTVDGQTADPKTAAYQTVVSQTSAPQPRAAAVIPPTPAHVAEPNPIQSPTQAAASAQALAPIETLTPTSTPDGDPVSTVGSAAPASAPAENAPPALLPEAMRLAHKCSACGFPISQGRNLCLDCEQKARNQNSQSQNAQTPNTQSQNVRARDVQSDAPQNGNARGLEIQKQDVLNNDALNREVQNNEALNNAAHSPAATQPLAAHPDSSVLPSDIPSNLASDLSPGDVLPPFLANAEPFKESWFSNLRNVLLILVLIAGAFVLYVVLH
jgi:putative methionine-R-sulfoxide reductase with GAF domain/uncharacterized Zn finger protein (UPF0148 family)